MKHLKWIGILVFTLGVIFAGFLFWASSSSLAEKDLTFIKQFSVGNTGISPDTFTVMTYNIGYLSGMSNNLPVREDRQFYQSRLRRAVKLLNDLKPGVVCFQEIDFHSNRSYFVNQLDSLAVDCGFSFAAGAVNWDKNYVPFPNWPPSTHFGKVISGQAVLSRYPIVKQSRVVLDRPKTNPFYYDAFYLERLAQVVEIEIGKRTLIVINVHLEAYDREAREKQADEVAKIYLQYIDTYPVLLTGDFNSDPSFKPMQADKTIAIILRDSRIQMAFSTSQATEMKNTFSSQKPDMKIDYIFYNSNKIELLDRFVVESAGDISDHLPVAMKFRFKDSGGMQ